MRRRGRRDGNHTDLVRGLRQLGASVQDLADVGGGCPDLLVGLQGRTLLLEVKDGARPPSERRLTEDEEDWIAGWRGSPVYVVSSLEEALQAAVGGYEARNSCDVTRSGDRGRGSSRQASGAPNALAGPPDAKAGHPVRRRILG